MLKNDLKIRKLRAILPPTLIACIAALLLLCHLGDPYLWQDEAATAVLAKRMLQFGRPLAYDGVNLITIDHFAAEDKGTVDQRTKDPPQAVGFYVRRGDFKADTTWKWQPWGQFVAAAASFKIFGATTLAARLPFALAGIVTVLTLYWFAFAYFENPQLAFFAGLFLALNSYWVLHSRQCRYYSLSSLFLVITMVSYVRWQRGARWGAAAFVTAAWCWFQVDYGTVWPVLGVLFIDSLVAQRSALWRPAIVGTVLAATIAPFAYYYELWGRHSIATESWRRRFDGNLLNINEFVVPILILGVAIAILACRFKTLPASERRFVVTACAIFGLLFFWIPSVAPAAFLRYSIMTAPLGCLLVAWVLVRLGSFLPRGLTWVGAAIFLFTPWLSLPPHVLKPTSLKRVSIFKPELGLLVTIVSGTEPDPNKPVIDWLQQNARPDDEILINYEDIPLMFYLPNPIRGGISSFRVEDDSKRPPDFLVLRSSVDFVYWPAFLREKQRYDWAPASLDVPDIPCGNCPDPVQRYDFEHAQSLFVARRVGAQ